MRRINYGRMILSGIIIGVIVDIVEGLLNGWLIADQWEAALAAIGKPPFVVTDIIAFNVYGLIVGIMCAWIYAGFRPRFGAGHRTAILAALTTWVLGYFLVNATIVIMGAAPFGLMLIVAVVGLVEIIVASLVGNYFYREDA